MDRPKSKDAPSTLSWDLWLGPAPARDYHEGLAPFAWRGWLDFGTGALGDMACHTCNLTFMGLKLGYPTSVQAVSSELNKESFPKWSTITFQFPARGKLPALKLVWYDGKKTDKEQNLPPEEIIKGLEVYGKDKKAVPTSGCLLFGSKGLLFSPDDYGAKQILLSTDRKEMAIQKPEASLPRSPGQNHYQEWVNACKGGKPCLSNFDYAGLLTESILLGVVALRAGKKIDWDGENMRVTNVSDANQFLRREYRKGWTL
jgi:predicted dehydrogenase